MTTVRIMKKNTPHIRKELWKLNKKTIKWPPYVKKIRKLLVETANQMEKKVTK